MEQNKVTKVFISYGYNQLLALKLKNFITARLGLQPIILAEQPDMGLTIIEKLERYAKGCDFALIVLTADDQTIGGGVRARQNVIHELGFFHGLLGRDRVLLLKQSGVELFSNISGLIYKEFGGDKIELIFEDMRIALETGSAQSGGKSVPRSEADDTKTFTTAMDIISHDWPKIERGNLFKDANKVIRDLLVEMQVKRLESFLKEQREVWVKRLDEAEVKFEESTKRFAADPAHGGKMAAMALDSMIRVSPKSTIDFIDKLLNEITFCTRNGIAPKDTISRIFGFFGEEN